MPRTVPAGPTRHAPREAPEGVAPSALRLELGWALLAALAAGGAWLVHLSTRQTARWPLGVFLLLVAGAAALYAFAVDRFFRRATGGAGRGPTPAESAVVATLAPIAEGDLVRAQAAARGLPERFARSLEGAIAALTELAARIQDGSVEVARAAGSVEQIASEIAAGSSEQAASVVEITAAMEELAKTAAQIAANVGHQAALAVTAEARGVAGAAAVDEAVAGVEEVQSGITAIAARADALGARSKEIFRVLDLIAEIAHETHILSLNAAIEASTAGEQGRRFAVVSEEVRRLAKRSQESVQSVRRLLDDFAASLRATVLATEEGSKEAAAVLERARAAAGAIGELRDAVGDTAKVAREISLVTQQQNKAADEVLTTLRELSRVVERMTRDLNQLSAMSAQLHQVGLDIQLVAQFFRLDSPRSLRHLAEEWRTELRPEDDAATLERKLTGLLERHPEVEAAYVANNEGRMLALEFGDRVPAEARAPARERIRQVDFRARPWFQAVARERRVVLIPPYVSVTSGQHVFAVAGPLFAADGSLTAVLGLDVSVTGWTAV